VVLRVLPRHRVGRSGRAFGAPSGTFVCPADVGTGYKGKEGDAVVMIHVDKLVSANR